MRRLAFALAAILLAVAAANAAEEAALPTQHWSFDGPRGSFDRAAMQRGFQIYQEICSVCHAVRHLYYRDLEELGYSEEEVKAIAAQAKVMDGPNDAGEMYERPGRPSDPIVRPFPNDNAARAANNGALPPDLSLITKARKGGADYVFAILTGYHEAPAGMKLGQGMRYNTYFPGNQIAMPPPLSDDAVQYGDGTKATVDQMAHDVATFLSWAAEPNLEPRHRMGVMVLIFLLVTTALVYGVKRKIWADVH
jgi:ubiquinol-cytochrome c reductase cytochrome c1 subunit